MKKQKLTFKVDGGLEKVAALFETSKNDRQVIENFGNNPASLLEALSIQPSHEIRISEGYKKLASTLDTIDFDKWHDTFEPAKEEQGCFDLQQKAFTSLWHAVNGYDPSLHAGHFGDDFEQANAVVIVVTYTMTVTMASTNGYTPKKQPPAPQAPAADYAIVVVGGPVQVVVFGQNRPKFNSRSELAYMSRYAQIVAEQIGWFS